MRSSSIRVAYHATEKALFAATSSLRCNNNNKNPTDTSTTTATSSPSNDSDTSSSSTALSLKERQLKNAEGRAERFGFMKRQGDFNTQVWMQSNFSQAEILPSGIRIYNLPPATTSSSGSEEEGQLKQYVKSTSDFMSQVTPNSTVGVGLGAGFGQRPDKRLGWLRPRQKDHLTPLPPDEEKEMMLRKVEEEGIQDLPEAKTPEERKEQIQRMLTYMKSFEGTTLSGTGGHTLLADLDFEKDSLLFGRTREEFIHNVETLKRVILNYEKWERTDNGYRYGTIVMQFSCLWLLIDCIQTWSRYQLLRDHFDDFVLATEEELELLKTKQAHDKQLARLEIQGNPPNYQPVVEQIVTERRRALAAEAGDATVNDTTTTSSFSLLNHPMDTTKEEATKLQAHQAQQRRDMQTYIADEPIVAGGGAANDSGKGWRRVLFGWLGGGSGKKKEGTDSKGSDGAAAAAVVVEGGVSADDIAKYSYAAAPTSIAAVRALRRVLLPRSDDFTQIVREEMAAYQLEKDTTQGYRSS